MLSASEPWLNCWVPYSDLHSFGINLTWAMGIETADVCTEKVESGGVCNSDGDTQETGKRGVFTVYNWMRRRQVS